MQNIILGNVKAILEPSEGTWAYPGQVWSLLVLRWCNLEAVLHNLEAICVHPGLRISCKVEAVDFTKGFICVFEHSRWGRKSHLGLVGVILRLAR